MTYPTLPDVEAASKLQLARWYRFLPSPGMSAIGRSDFEETMTHEAEVQDRILKRFADLGGWTPELSKQVGW